MEVQIWIILIVIFAIFWTIWWGNYQERQYDKTEQQKLLNQRIEKEKLKEDFKLNQKLLKNQIPLFFGLIVDGTPEEFIKKLKEKFELVYTLQTKKHTYIVKVNDNNSFLHLKVNYDNELYFIRFSQHFNFKLNKLKIFNDLIEKYEKLNYPVSTIYKNPNRLYLGINNLYEKGEFTLEYNFNNFILKNYSFGNSIFYTITNFENKNKNDLKNIENLQNTINLI